MTATTPQPLALTGERTDLLETLRKHRGFLRYAASGVTDEQARQRTTVSELTLGGLIKHVAITERNWFNFMLEGAPALQGDPESWMNGHRLLEGETLDGWLAEHEKVAARTDEFVATLDLDEAHALPEAPWFEPGAAWSNRRVLLHLIAETSQHAGHADIVRESLDGQRTMG